MNIFTNKKLIQKIIIIFIIILLFQYAVPSNISNAADGWGGTLFLPVQEFSLAIGDVGSNALNLFVNGVATGSILTLDRKDFLDTVFSIAGEIGVLGPGIYPIYKIIKTVSVHFSSNDFVDQIELPILSVTPDKIFSNKIALLDVNIINPNTYQVKDKNGNDVEVESAASILQKTVSSWYVALRNIAIVAFLSVLVYIGIRILISSTSGDKAKFKQLLIDWVIGLCLLFFMHYIMSFSLLAVEKITDLFSSQIEGVVIEAEGVKLSDFKINQNASNIIQNFNENGTGTLKWKTDFAGYIRFFAQSNINSLSVQTQFAYTVMYLVLVIYTLLFVFQYLKRLINIVFLTLVAPIVALAYPLDKIADGKAQAFNTWVKEYIFNLLIQPMHLILYTVLVGSAIDLATEHPIYAIVVMGFLLQTEKLVRKLFGFEKASLTGAASTGAFAGAMVMQGVNAFVNKSKARDKALGAKDKGNHSSNNEDNRVRMADNRSADNSSDEDDFMRNALGSGNVGDNSQDKEVNNEKGDNNSEDNINNKGDYNKNNDNIINNNGENLNRQINTEEYYPNNVNNTKDENDDKNNSTNTNYLHRLNPEKYDEYGNYKARDGKNYTDKKNNKNQKILKSKPFRHVKAATRLYAPRVGKTLVKGAAMAVGAGTLGTIGLAAGLASDDFKNVGSYTAAAVAGGAVVGNIVADRTIKAPNSIKNMIQEKRDEYAREYYKDDPKGYKQYLNEKSDKEFLKNKEIKQQYVEEFGESRASEMMTNAIEYRKHGITDNKLIIKAMKENSGDIGKTSVTDDRRIAAAKLASGISNSKDIENTVKRLKSQGYKDNVISQNEEFIRSIKNLKYN